MNASTTTRLIAFARLHDTISDAGLALGILLVANIDALAEQPHPVALVVFNTALALPLAWRPIASRRWLRTALRLRSISRSKLARCGST
jgi:hypothetical protein